MTTKTGILFSLGCSSIFLFNCAPAQSEEVKLQQVKPEQVIARCKTKLATQEAVLLSLYSTQEYVVIAARNERLEGKLVHLRHIVGKNVDERRYLYFLSGCSAPVLNLPYLHDDLSLDEMFSLKQYYAAKGLPTIAPEIIRITKCSRTPTARKARKK